MADVTFARSGRIAVLTIDNPPVNAMAIGIPGALVRNLTAAIADPEIDGIVIRGAGTGTIAGADLREFGKPWPASEPTLRDAIDALDASRKPVVAALAGQCLGGGLELAMACNYRVAGPSAQVGQPEIKLGFPPGAGGTQRLPRLAGAEAALGMILEGSPVTSAKAHALGVIDAIIEGDLLAGAVSFAKDRIAAGVLPRARDKTVVLKDPGLFAKARAEAGKRRQASEAALACINCVEASTTKPFDQGVAYERELFETCAFSDQSKALRHAFFAERAASKVPGISKEVRLATIASAAVIGAGTMGGGITMCFADAGIPVRLVDANPEALERGLATIRRNYEATAAKGRLTVNDVARRMELIRPIVDFRDLADADIVIEAVFEEMPIKQEVFRKLDAAVKPGAILASNTSYLDVDAIADTVPARRGYVLGTHFFSPANVMRLLEVVRAKSVKLEALASVLALGRRLRKIPVVSGVCFGFIANRMLEGYLREAEFLLEEGATPGQVDKTVMDFGFPMGPFAMVDLAGLDIGWRKRKAGAHLRNPSRRYSPVNDRLCEMGRFGQKTGAGWYQYEKGSRAPISDPVVDQIVEASAREQGITRRELSSEEIIERCFYPLVNQGARILDEGIALRSGDIDVVWINGFGFPATRGGPMFWADTVELAKVRDAISRIGQSQDGWDVAPLLDRLAREGRTFTSLDAA
jgi:3-hydroxyacyl-CoA dehydrogenase